MKPFTWVALAGLIAVGAIIANEGYKQDAIADQRVVVAHQLAHKGVPIATVRTIVPQMSDDDLKAYRYAANIMLKNHVHLGRFTIKEVVADGHIFMSANDKTGLNPLDFQTTEWLYRNLDN